MPSHEPALPDDLTPLPAWMEAHVPGFHGALSARIIKGGQSNPTYLLTADSGRYVLRRKPVGDLLPSAHAVDREHRVMAALAGTAVPVPRVYDCCTDPDVIGSIFYVMDFVPGRVLFEPSMPELDRADRAVVFDQMNQTIAALHAIEPASVGLADYGRPSRFVARQIDRWTKQFRASATGPSPAMEQLITWLPQHLPPEQPARIIHGDYRLDNVMLHESAPRVVAVLDWELSTLGDPLADFANHAAMWRISPAVFRGLDGVDLAAEGLPGEAEYVAAYCRRTGRARIDNWEFYLAFGLFRLSAILQGIAKRALDGTAAHPDAQALGAMAGPVAERAWSVAQGRL